MGASDANTGKATNGYDFAVAAVGLLRGALWPGLVLFIFLILMQPIVQTIRLIPALASRTDVISFGEFKVELSEQLQNISAEPRITAALAGLSEDGMRLLLSISGPQMAYCGHTSMSRAREGADNLERNGLANTGDRDNVDGGDSCLDVNLTDLGEDSRDFMISFIAEALR